MYRKENCYLLLTENYGKDDGKGFVGVIKFLNQWTFKQTKKSVHLNNKKDILLVSDLNLLLKRRSWPSIKQAGFVAGFEEALCHNSAAVKKWVLTTTAHPVKPPDEDANDQYPLSLTQDAGRQ